MTEQRDIMAAIVTHDLKNHLVSESWILDLVLAGDYGDINDKQKQPLRMLKAGTETQLRMTSNLVEIYRYDVGTDALNRTVSVEARNNNGSVVITVSDTGRGIPEEDLAVLFKGTWLGPKPHRMVGSTGIGLFLCKRILDAHGAQIACATGDGSGTVFTITIPGSAV